MDAAEFERWWEYVAEQGEVAAMAPERRALILAAFYDPGVVREDLAAAPADRMSHVLAFAGAHALLLLLRKAHDYDYSALQPPVLAGDLPAEAALRCRMSDKVARLARAFAAGDGSLALPDERIDDTLDDLIGYAVLLRVTRAQARRDGGGSAEPRPPEVTT